MAEYFSVCQNTAYTACKGYRVASGFEKWLKFDHVVRAQTEPVELHYISHGINFTTCCDSAHYIFMKHNLCTYNTYRLIGAQSCLFAACKKF